MAYYLSVCVLPDRTEEVQMSAKKVEKREREAQGWVSSCCTYFNGPMRLCFSHRRIEKNTHPRKCVPVAACQFALSIFVEDITGQV